MLDNRLNTIFEMIEKDLVVADIGTDHAFLPIKLIKENKAKYVYACDVLVNPLNIARNNIKSYNLEDKIEVVLSDGLLNLNNDVDVVVIAGMGFYSVESILENSFERLNSFKQIIIQVNNNVDLLRKWISDNNFTIVNEKIVNVKHYYTIIEFNTNFHNKYSEDEILFGTILMKEKSKEFIDYLNYRLNKLNNILLNVKDENKIKELNEMIDKIKKVLN